MPYMTQRILRVDKERDGDAQGTGMPFNSSSLAALCLGVWDLQEDRQADKWLVRQEPSEAAS